MTGYSIKNMEALSGIKAQNIRVWERRYDLFSPSRTETNLRIYSDDDLVKLMNIAVLIRHGNKISRLAPLSNQELKELVLALNYKPFLHDTEIEKLITATMELNEKTFVSTIENNSATLGFEECVKEVIFPFLIRIGLLWQSGDVIPVQEHFASNLIRSIFIKSIGELETDGDRDQSALLFLPKGEEHELSLLFYTYIAKSEGFNVIYLGKNTPDADLEALAGKNFDLLVSAFITTISGIDLKEYIFTLANKFSHARILLTGEQLKRINFQLPDNVKVVSSSENFRKHLPQ